MATRLLAKKYLRDLEGWRNACVGATERQCLEMLIESHRAMYEMNQQAHQRAVSRGWFGRMLWRLFGRWL